MRSALVSLRSRWREVLTDGQRDGWASYAAATPVDPETGPSRVTTGEMMYVRGNAVRLQAAVPGGPVDEPPSVYGLPWAEVVAVSVVAALASWAVVYRTTGAWVTETGAALVVYGSRPQNSSVNRNRWGHELVGSVLGDPGSPPSGFDFFPWKMKYVGGQRVFGRVVLLRADGRVGEVFQRPDFVV